jgi:hypothetical protein
MSSQVPFNLDAKEPFSGTQVSELEHLLEISNGLVNGRGRRGDNSGIIHIDRKNDLGRGRGENVAGMIRLQSFETHGLQLREELLVPLSSRLLEAIERLLELEDLGIRALRKAFWLGHVNIFFQVTIEIGRGEVNGSEMEIMSSSKGKNDPESSRLEGRSKNLIKINPISLLAPISHQPSLVPLNGSIRQVLDVEDPLRPEGFTTLRQIHHFPCSILQQTVDLIHSSFSPQLSILSANSLFKTLGIT